MLFENEVTPADTQTDFMPAAVLAQRFSANPDPVLLQLGGSRVDLAIGLDRTMYQLEVAPGETAGEVRVYWSKAATVSLRPKKPITVPVPVNKVPVTLKAAISSLCETFGISAEAVWKGGVDLLAFWEGMNANERLELPMSKDWKRYSLARLHSV